MTEGNRSSRVGLEKGTEGIVEWGSGRKPIRDGCKRNESKKKRIKKKKEKRERKKELKKDLEI